MKLQSFSITALEDHRDRLNNNANRAKSASFVPSTAGTNQEYSGIYTRILQLEERMMDGGEQ